MGKSGVDAGGAVVEILISGPLDNWIMEYNLNVTVVVPKDDLTKSELGGREWTHILDTQNNTIVFSRFGSFSSGGESSVAAGIEELKRLTGEL